MPSRLTLLLVFAVGFIAASNADASPKSKRSKPAAAPTVASSCRGSNLFHCGPIYNSNDYLGDDPDPFIRLMIQRDLGAKYGGEE
jgi:hypothetical protein